jgi:hypothetical protein
MRAASAQHRMAYWEWGRATRQRRMWWCACMASRARGAISIPWPAALCRRHARGLPDVVGRGHSDWLADPDGLPVPTYVADMLALLGQLQQQAPIADAGLGGHQHGRADRHGAGGQPGSAGGCRVGSLCRVPVRRWCSTTWARPSSGQALQRIGQYLGQPVTLIRCSRRPMPCGRMSASFGPHTPEQWLALSRPWCGRARGRLALHYDPAIAVPFAR